MADAVQTHNEILFMSSGRFRALSKACAQIPGRVNTLIRSIRGIFLLSFLIFAFLFSAFAYYAITSIQRTSTPVTRTYDRPLMAINFARSALFAFSQMDRSLARIQLASNQAERARHLAELERFRVLFAEDLAIAEERSMSVRSIGVIKQISALEHRWDTLRTDVPVSDIDAQRWAELDALATLTTEHFELLIDLTAGDGFLIRQDALQTIENSRVTNMVAVGAAMSLAILAALVLSRSILRPLGTAVAVANRIAAGELQAEIPRRGAGETGAVLSAMAVMQDNLRTMMSCEIEMRESAQLRLVDALERSGEGAILADADGRIVIVNSQVLKYLAPVQHFLEPKKSLKRALSQAWQLGYISGQGDVASGDVASGDVASGDAVASLLHADGPDGRRVGEIRLGDDRWLRVSHSPTRDGGVVVIMSDITELMEREEALLLAKEQAESASNAKTHFLANISHELRTPLNAIIGFSDIIAQQKFGPLPNERYREYAGDILSSGKHLLDIINDILDLSKCEAGALAVRLMPLEIEPLVESCVHLLEDQCAQAGLQISVTLEPGLPAVMADVGRSKQILLNLLSNAMKFTPSGGRLTVEVRDAGETVRIDVTDNGIGMSPDEIIVALQPFNQVDTSMARKFEGTGLGLPLSKKLAELQGGVLSVKSEPNQGTTVSVDLPAAGDAAIEIAAEAADSAAFG